MVALGLSTVSNGQLAKIVKNRGEISNEILSELHYCCCFFFVLFWVIDN